MVSCNRLLSILSSESAPIKRIIQEAKVRNMLIDATYGRRTKSVLIMDSGHIILSGLQPETIYAKFEKDNNLIDDGEIQ